jgi:hypothetical protein
MIVTHWTHNLMVFPLAVFFGAIELPASRRDFRQKEGNLLGQVAKKAVVKRGGNRSKGVRGLCGGNGGRRSSLRQSIWARRQ